MTPWWARWRRKSPATRLFTQPFIQSISKKTPKLRATGLCEGNSSVTGEFPAQRPVMRKLFPFDDVIMIFSEIHLDRYFEVSIYCHNDIDSLATLFTSIMFPQAIMLQYSLKRAVRLQNAYFVSDSWYKIHVKSREYDLSSTFMTWYFALLGIFCIKYSLMIPFLC